MKARISCPMKLKEIYPCNLSAPCPDAILQLDLFNPQFNEAVGCKRLTKKEWESGFKEMMDNDFPKQSNCPLLKGIPDDPEIS